jgi:Protein of unknown function (DUF4245)
VSDASAPPPAARSGRSPRDMALSLAVLLVPVFLLLIVYRLVFSGDAPIGVNAGDTWATARHGAHYAVLEPAGLPAKWTVISATFAGGTLRVGYVTPDAAGLQLIESDQPVDRLLPAELGTDARPGDLVTIGGRQWRTYPVARDGNRALVLADADRTTIVIGTASDTDLRTLAAALR